MACVKDLLSLDSFRPMELAAGHGGLYRPVSWPNIAQTPSIREWLIGGDVIIMTGIGLECTDEFLNSIVEQAVEKKAACLIVLLSPEHIPAIPAQTAVFAEKSAFPIFAAPWDTHIAEVVADISQLLLLERYRQEAFDSLLEELLFHNGGVPSETLRSFIKKQHVAGPHTAVVARFPVTEAEYSFRSDTLRRQAVNCMIQDVKCAFPGTLYLNRQQEIIFLVRLERSELPRLKKTLLSVCRSIRKQWILAAPVCGVGEIYEEPLLLRRSADEAGRAAGMNSREPVTLFEELGIFRLLAECPDQEAVREFAVSRLKPLLDYDLENRKNLLQTLETYLLTNGSATETAERLYMHRNTVTYQLTKIRELLNMDTEDAEHRNMLFNYLKIYHYCQR